MPRRASRAAMDRPAWPPPTTRTAGSRSSYRDCFFRTSSQFGPAKSRTYSRPSDGRSSWPRRSSRAVINVQQENVSGKRRTTPLAGPSFVSKRNIASMQGVPARVTCRAGVRAGSTRKPRGRAWAAAWRNAPAMASAPLSVPIFQVSARTSRQWPSPQKRAFSAGSSPRAAGLALRTKASSSAASQRAAASASVWSSCAATARV